jgi:hypothetical protein
MEFVNSLVVELGLPLDVRPRVVEFFQSGRNLLIVPMYLDTTLPIYLFLPNTVIAFLLSFYPCVRGKRSTRGLGAYVTY